MTKFHLVWTILTLGYTRTILRLGVDYIQTIYRLYTEYTPSIHRLYSYTINYSL